MAHSKDRVVTPVIIGVVVALLLAAGTAMYAWIFSRFAMGRGVAIAIVAIGVALVAALAWVVGQRIQELKRENPDDYRNY